MTFGFFQQQRIVVGISQPLRQFLSDLTATTAILASYRNLYLHFENACLFIYNAVVLQAKDDFLRTQEKSAQILLEDMGDLKKYRSLLRSIYYAVLRLFAPLL